MLIQAARELFLVPIPTQQRLGSDQFSSTDVDELTWRFNSAEADFGVRSTQSGIEATLNRLAIGEGAAKEERRDQCERGAMRRELEAMATLSRAAIDLRLDDQTMCISDDSGGGVLDPLGEDIGQVARLMAKWRRVEKRLHAIDYRHYQVLYAVYGPARGDAQTNTLLRKKFANLFEIVVVFVAAASESGNLVEARGAALRKANADESFVTMQKKQAEKLLKEAQDVYGKAKIAWT